MSTSVRREAVAFVPDPTERPRPSPRRGIRLGPVGLRWRTGAASLAVLLVLVLLVLLASSLVTGTLSVPLSRIWAVLTGDGTRLEQIVVERRIARGLGAVLIGFCLGVAGAMTQSITRNPIASPDILGVTGGAAAVAVFVITTPWIALGPGPDALAVLAPLTIVGGFVTTAFILALSWRGGFDGLRLVLVGLGVTAFTGALVSWMITRSESSDAALAIQWLIGSLDALRLRELWMLVPAALVGLLGCLVLSRSISALRLGREVASGTGTSPGRAELLTLVVAVLLTSVATAAAGPIAFVAFVAPQAALRAFRTAGPPLLAAGLVGALLLLGADTVAQRLPTPLPVGIVTSVVGAPFLLYLLTRHLRRTSV